MAKPVVARLFKEGRPFRRQTRPLPCSSPNCTAAMLLPEGVNLCIDLRVSGWSP